MAESSQAVRGLILQTVESVPLPNKMDQEIASEINRGLFHQNAPAYIRIMIAKRDTMGVIPAITRQNAMCAMELVYCDIINNAVCSVDKGVNDAEEDESWQRRKIHAVPLVMYIAKGTEGLQKMWDEIYTENEGVAILIQVH